MFSPVEGSGSGRKKADYETKTIAFRVRVEWVDVIKSAVKAKVAELSQNSTQRFGYCRWWGFIALLLHTGTKV